MSKRITMTVCMIAALVFLTSPALADTVGGVTGFTATGNNGTILSITYGTTTYQYTDLINGETKRYDSSGVEQNPGPTFSANADNISFASGNVTTLDSLPYLITIFDQPATIFFILESGNKTVGGSDSGTIYGITGFDSLDNPVFGTGTSFTAGSYFNSTYLGGFDGSRYINVLAFQTESPVYGIKIAAPGMDPASITAAVPIPAAAWLLGTGLVGLIALKRRSRS